MILDCFQGYNEINCSGYDSQWGEEICHFNLFFFSRSAFSNEAIYLRPKR